MNGARVGKGCLIAAGSVVKEQMQIPDYSLVAGVPARVMKIDPALKERTELNAIAYLHLKQKYAEGKIKSRL